MSLTILIMTDPNNRSKNHSLIHVEPFGQDELTIADYFTSKFDYKIDRNMYTPHKNTLAIYDLFRQIMVDSAKKIQTPIITLSPDPSISASTIAGAAEKFILVDNDERDRPIVHTSLHVLYFDMSPDLSSEPYDTYDAYKGAVLSDVLGIRPDSFSMRRVVVPPQQVAIIGLDDDMIDEDQRDTIIEKKLDIYTIQQIKLKGIENIMKIIIDKFKFQNVHIVFDLSCVQKKFAPSVLREEYTGPMKKTTDIGFDLEQIQHIMTHIKELKYLNGIDIVGYNFGPKSEREKHTIANLITVKTISLIVTSIIPLDQKSINLFNEESKFLIWRRVDDPDPIGWHILRNMELSQREEIIKAVGDKIETIPIQDDDESYYALIAVTTIKEQREKSYYVSKSLNDMCLTPNEKVSMLYELLNTPTYQLVQEKQLSKELEKEKENI